MTAREILWTSGFPDISKRRIALTVSHCLTNRKHPPQLTTGRRCIQVASRRRANVRWRDRHGRLPRLDRSEKRHPAENQNHPAKTGLNFILLQKHLLEWRQHQRTADPERDYAGDCTVPSSCRHPKRLPTCLGASHSQRSPRGRG